MDVLPLGSRGRGPEAASAWTSHEHGPLGHLIGADLSLAVSHLAPELTRVPAPHPSPARTRSGCSSEGAPAVSENTAGLCLSAAPPQARAVSVGLSLT